MLPFDQLQLVMSKLRFADETALRTIGLAKLSKSFDAYPYVDGGRKLYCLLPKGMDVSQARQLSLGAASQKIIVLQQGARGYAKVWPSAEGMAQAAAQPLKQAVGQSPVAPAPQPQAEPEGPLGDLEIVEE